MRIFLPLLLLLPVAVCFADSSKTINFRHLLLNSGCSEEVSGGLELRSAEGLINVKVRHLYSTAVVSERLVCSRLLEELKKIINQFSEDLEIPLRQISDGSDNLTYYDSSGFLDKQCVELGFCKSSILDYFSLNETLRDCSGSPDLELLISQSAPKILKTQTRVIKDLTVKIHPLEPLAEALKTELSEPNNSEIFASTMTLGSATMYAIGDKLKQHAGIGLSLGFNLETLLSENQLGFLSFPFSGIDRLWLIPFTSGLNFGTIYHLKYFSVPASGRSAISAMNLSTPENSKYLDLIYHFADPEIAGELAALNYKNVSKQCKALKDLDCSLEFYPAAQQDKDFLRNAFIKTCREHPHSDYKPSGHFAYSDTHDLEKMVTDFISAANNEVILFSYILTNPRVVSALKNARDRGVKILAISAYRSSLFGKDDTDHIYYEDQSGLVGTYPHLKAILRDGQSLLFGSANFSNNALKSAHEMLAVTDNKAAIESAYDLAAVFVQSTNPALSRSLSRHNPAEQYIVLHDSAISQNLPGLITPQQSWMKSYKLAGPELRTAIKNCRMDHLLFINEKALITCMEK